MSWYRNKSEVPKCGICVHWCNIKDCQLEAQYREVNKVITVNHTPCDQYKRVTNTFTRGLRQ